MPPWSFGPPHPGPSGQPGPRGQSETCLHRADLQQRRRNPHPRSRCRPRRRLQRGNRMATARRRANLSGAALEGTITRHPFLDRTAPVFPADFVTMEAGTGCVHIAPGHGADDFQLGKARGLDILCPVDDLGRFTAECGVDAWIGQPVFAANPLVVEHVKSNGALLGVTPTSIPIPTAGARKRRSSSARSNNSSSASTPSAPTPSPRSTPPSGSPTGDSNASPARSNPVPTGASAANAVGVCPFPSSTPRRANPSSRPTSSAAWPTSWRNAAATRGSKCPTRNSPPYSDSPPARPKATTPSTSGSIPG